MNNQNLFSILISFLLLMGSSSINVSAQQVNNNNNAATANAPAYCADFRSQCEGARSTCTQTWSYRCGPPPTGNSSGQSPNCGVCTCGASDLIAPLVCPVNGVNPNLSNNNSSASATNSLSNPNGIPSNANRPDGQRTGSGITNNGLIVGVSVVAVVAVLAIAGFLVYKKKQNNSGIRRGNSVVDVFHAKNATARSDSITNKKDTLGVASPSMTSNINNNSQSSSSSSMLTASASVAAVGSSNFKPKLEEADDDDQSQKVSGTTINAPPPIALNSKNPQFQHTNTNNPDTRFIVKELGSLECPGINPDLSSSPITVPTSSYANSSSTFTAPVDQGMAHGIPYSAPMMAAATANTMLTFDAISKSAQSAGKEEIILQGWSSQQPDELNLIPYVHTIVILRSFDDGWCEGYCPQTRQTGFFPSTCLQEN